uniref:APC family permease n=1 Tax=Rhodococcus qingshengii TaxID=334542 RepID=UPI001C4E18C6|nr:APC family permease [Rhodococcus qingshengii]
MADIQQSPNPVGAVPESIADVGLATGHLSRLQISSLALTSYIPAVGMATSPFLYFAAGGFNAWPAALLSMVATICVGLAIVTFARRYVASGSLYSYIGEVFGPWARYVVGGSLLIGFVTQIAGTGGIVGVYFGSFLTTLGVGNGYDLTLQLVILAVTLFGAGLIAFRGLDTSVRVAVTLAFVSLPLMVLITVGSASHTGLDLAQQLDFEAFSVSGTFQGMASGIAFLVAFESCTALASETKDPKRNIPVAVMGVPVVLGIVYLVTTFLQVPGLAASADELAEGRSPASALNEVAGLPSWTGAATDLILAIATFSAVVGFTNYGSRFLVTLGVDQLLPTKVTTVHPRRQTPIVAIAGLLIAGFAVMAIAASLGGDYLSAYNIVVIAIVYSWVLPYILISAGAMVILVRARSNYPTVVASAIALCAMTWLFVNGLVYPPASPLDSLSWEVPLAIAVVAAGFAVADRRRMRKDIPSGAESKTPEQL